ncbi:MAG: cytochrome c oxidase subunit 3 [Acidobacteria bacterium]|nr:cytochrome c oxidase subunit 3 [Acidobacteriota bacterium]
MVTSTERVITKKNVAGKGARRTGGNGKFPRDGGGGNGSDGNLSAGGFSPDRYRIAIWVALASIMMLFTALSSAYIVRAAGANDWTPLQTPRLLWVSTPLILLSSVTFELARRSLKKNDQRKYAVWLLATVLLGLGFLVAQFLAWRELVGQGIYVSTNPHSSFFYLLTALHALHLLGGILALDYLLLHAWRRRAPAEIGARRTVAARAVATYWHFMGALWVYLFLLLFMWR